MKNTTQNKTNQKILYDIYIHKKKKDISKLFANDDDIKGKRGKRERKGK